MCGSSFQAYPVSRKDYFKITLVIEKTDEQVKKIKEVRRRMLEGIDFAYVHKYNALRNLAFDGYSVAFRKL